MCNGVKDFVSCLPNVSNQSILDPFGGGREIAQLWITNEDLGTSKKIRPRHFVSTLEALLAQIEYLGV